MAYRVPRRFIVPPDDPPPYGLFGLSFLAHALFFLMVGGVSAYVNARADQSKIYIVNLVPAAPAPGSPEPRAAAPAPPKPVIPERTPPRPQPVEPPRPTETPPPKPEKAETPPPRARPVDDAPPPREIARATPPRPTEMALPREARKETPALDSPATRARLIERPAAPPPLPATPPVPPRVAEPPRPVTPPVPTPPAVAAKPATPPVPLGRPDAAVPTTGSISLDVSDFPFTYYLRQIQAKISERWAPPRGTLAGGERVVVLFEIGRDGQIKEPAVEKSSGHAVYDQSAVRAVTEASPFPPLPPEFKAASLKVHFGFEFRPDQG